MQISRRALLSAVPAATLLALTPALRARAAEPDGADPAAASADRTALLANTVAIFAGTATSNARPEAAAKIAAIAATARSRLAAMDAATGAAELFHGVTLGTSDPNLTTSFQYLYETALATRAPGVAPDLYGSTAVQQRVADGLTWLYDHFYGDQSQGYYGNWFNWEIGMSTYVSKTLVLLDDYLTANRPDLASAYVAAMDGYLRNGKNGDVDLDSRFHTGANLADITTNRVLQGAVLGDDARISKALADQLTVYAAIDPYHLQHGVTDGFYADGSFIQHSSVAYTGSYGSGLLTRILQTIKMLDGTGYVQGDGLVGVVQGWVADAFAPLIFEGWMMEIVKGRAVSRTTTGYADVAAIVEAVVDLTGYAADGDATALGGYVKFVRQTSRSAPDPAKFVSPVSVVRYADILADDAIPARDLNAPAQHTAFAAMDRSVHRRPGYAFALSRSSTRISGYEYMSGENLMPWFQGAGAHYLYLTGQDQTQAYGIDYFTTVSPYALGGVTAPVETRETVPELYGTAWYDNPALGFTSSSVSQNTYVYFPLSTNAYSGGARLGAYGTAGYVQSDDAAYTAKQAGQLPDDFVAYRNADATKSWFMLDDEIVVLAAGVGDGAGRAVTTTLDTRIAGPSDAVALTGRLRGGTPWTGTGTGPLAWLRYADATQGVAVGYAFLDGPEATVALDTVSRSRRAVRTSNPDTTASKQVFSLSVDRPAGAPHTSLAYALVPHATQDALAHYDRGPLAVIANSTQVQAIRHSTLGLLAANAFTAGTHHAERLTVDGPASVILREERGTTSIAVADPTTGRDTVSVLVHGRAMRAVSADEGVTVRRVPGGTRLDVTTRQAYGRSFQAVLR
ncbi:polysaccharide lyase family 8 super-sandwich domain-containing protein [Actinacidiphila acidipaludis]|uniref:Silent information regulator protein Sir2 n=1 Tax=Actinacidiphila acidipaludis TaxID=2873382 RepID=A0ABS7QE17_9ACTN|nr:polysaccharide lyase family 8 super-sandwich domain-containing protein [Streptomyces acidipaludis]MBY8881425.1 silent information regulator protein Sir2 [Streptomyces acidipaludis]